uniref:GLIPR1-like protein 2 n=1 Tax=Ciona intestinalis TaxID=7719 RepID=UPI00089DC320|nr:GLIPR1-like protein 2 [Ciona intestinalis]|eukprot:XP_009861542.2 GLIPR1-like protein 2 [Ciona intestinalis]
MAKAYLCRIIFMLQHFVGFLVLSNGIASEKLSFDEDSLNNILRGHNHLRTHNATPSAADMRFITWDDQLANEASDWSSDCQYDYKEYFELERWENIGQNFYMSKEGVEWTADFQFKPLLKWMWQQRNFNHTTLTCNDNSFCLEYVQLMCSKTYKIGCGASRCPEMNTGSNKAQNVIFYVCFYGPKCDYTLHEIGSMPYKIGDQCSQCENENDTCTKNLCENGQRDKPYVHKQKTPSCGGMTGPVIGAIMATFAAGVVAAILKKITSNKGKISPTQETIQDNDVDLSEKLKERADPGDGTSKPATPISESARSFPKLSDDEDTRAAQFDEPENEKTLNENAVDDNAGSHNTINTDITEDCPANDDIKLSDATNSETANCPEKNDDQLKTPDEI